MGKTSLKSKNKPVSSTTKHRASPKSSPKSKKERNSKIAEKVKSSGKHVVKADSSNNSDKEQQTNNLEAAAIDTGAGSMKSRSVQLNKALATFYREPIQRCEQYSLKIVSWNINGLKSFLKKEDAMSYVRQANADVVTFQEIKCDAKTLPAAARNLIPGYSSHFSSAEKAGYAGTALYSKLTPIKVTFGLGDKKHDEEGRIITAELDRLFVVSAYVPNSGRGLPRLAYRTGEWDLAFMAYLKRLDSIKPVVLCGDLNVAHLATDLANPNGNERTAGFTPHERQRFTELLESGFVDTFRALYPQATGKYSFWSTMHNARASNTGWRLDYFVVSKRIVDAGALHDSIIDADVLGSDHAPIILTLDLSRFP